MLGPERSDLLTAASPQRKLYETLFGQAERYTTSIPAPRPKEVRPAMPGRVL
jgi:hypothetical protein